MEHNKKMAMERRKARMKATAITGNITGITGMALYKDSKIRELKKILNNNTSQVYCFQYFLPMLVLLLLLLLLSIKYVMCFPCEYNLFSCFLKIY